MRPQKPKRLMTIPGRHPNPALSQGWLRVVLAGTGQTNTVPQSVAACLIHEKVVMYAQDLALTAAVCSFLSLLVLFL
jgi:hypothetical protein